MMRIKSFIFLICVFHNALAATNWLAQLVHAKEQAPAQHIDRQFNRFFDAHALVLFFASTCPHCHSLAPILKKWATDNQADVLPLSFDNQPLPEFPRFLPATTEWTSAAFKDNEISYPALFILNRKTQVLYPVSVGGMTAVELHARMQSLIPKINYYEQNGAA